MDGTRCRGDAPGNEEIGEQRHQHGQAHRLTQLDESQIRARVLEHHGLVDHGQLEMGTRIVDREATALGHDHDDEGHQGQQALRGGQPQGMGERAGDDGRQVGGVGGHRQGENGDQQCRLGQGPDGHGPAGPHAPEGRPRVEGPEGQGDRAEQQQEDDGEQVG